MKIKLRLIVTVGVLVAGMFTLAHADYVVLDGNRNPQTFKSIQQGGGQQLQQTTPTDPTGTPFSQTDPQYFMDAGVPGTGLTPPAGGTGLSGWLSGIYNALASIGVTSTDASGTITSAGVYQTAIAASSSRRGCFIQNPVTAVEVLNVKFGTMAQPITLSPGGSVSCAVGNIVLQGAVTVMGASSGHAYAGLAQ